MTRPHRLAVPFCALLLVCGLARAEAPAPAPVQDFGAGITLDEPTPLGRLLESPERYASEKVLVSGRLTEVCQRKGCWTLLQDGDAQVRVRFLDYGFFLPKDSAGRQAWVEGRVTVRTLSESEARHYESERPGGDPQRIRGPQREVGFVASGVRLAERAAPADPE